MDAPMVSICAWCEGSREKTAQALAVGAIVTHSICESCLKKALEAA